MSLLHAWRYLRASGVVLSKSCWPAHLVVVLTPQHLLCRRGQRKPSSSETSIRVARPSSIRKHGPMHNGAQPERVTPLAATRYDRFIPPPSRQRGASRPLGHMRTLKRPGSTSSLRLPILRKILCPAHSICSSWASAAQLYTYDLTLRPRRGTCRTLLRLGEHKSPVQVAGFPPVSHVGRSHVKMHSRAT
jgi:hypothetical protein